MNKYRFIWIVFVAIFVTSTAGIWIAHARGKVEKKETSAVWQVAKNQVKIADSAKQNIELITVEPSKYNEQIDIMGKIAVTENGTTVVPSRSVGRIENIYVTSGETVKKGQLLAKIYSADFAAAREEYLQTLRSSENGKSSDFKNLHQMSYKKLKSLGLSGEDIDNIASSDSNLLNVHAPASGVIIDKKALLGNSVTIGDSLFSIADLSKVWFLGDLYPEDLPKVRRGQEVSIEATGNPVYGKVSFISPIVDPNSRTIKIRVLMDNREQLLRADMYVQAHIILSSNNVITVPSTAVFNEEGKNYLFKKLADQDANQNIDQNNIFEKIEVETGSGRNNQTVIKSGIAAGDIVIGQGSLLLNSVIDNSVYNQDSPKLQD